MQSRLPWEATDERQVELAGPYRVELRGHRPRIQPDGEVGRLGPQPGDARRHPCLEPRTAAEPDDPSAAAGELGGDGAGAVGDVEHGASLDEHPFAVGGEPDVPRGPVEQLDPELALQPAHLLADRGLHDVQALGGTAEVELLRDGDEVPELPQLHLNPDRSAAVIAVQTDRALAGDLPAGLTAGMRTGLWIDDEGTGLDAMVAQVREAASLGYDGVWLSQRDSWDVLTLLTAVARSEPHIDLGTSIVTTYPRPPCYSRRRAHCCAVNRSTSTATT